MKINPFIPVVAALLITGCASTQEPKLYILQTPSVPETAGIKSDAPSLFIAPLQLPGYLDRLSIVTQSGEHEIVHSEFHRWAEPLDESLRQKLADSLSKTIQSDRVFSEGRHAPKDTDFRIEVQIVQLTGTLGKTAQLEARWTILSGTGERIKMVTFQQNAPLSNATHLSYVQAQSKLLAELTGAIAASIPPKTSP